MHGNVSEWCQDWYDVYPGGTALDPQGPATGSHRVIRGGYWYNYAWSCRSAGRDDYDYPDGRYGGIGFRVVLAPGQP
jgi:formylglycine-generating enzyme required for sulfatase activity